MSARVAGAGRGGGTPVAAAAHLLEACGVRAGPAYTGGAGRGGGGAVLASRSHTECVCERRKGSVFCGACGHTCPGRVKAQCPQHPHITFLFDFRQCPNCKVSTFLHEF